jgi:hypothetical protein
MNKPVHPIRRMRRSILDRFDDSVRMFLAEDELVQLDRVIARHVRPLLDALEDDHGFAHGTCDSSRWDPTGCPKCALLAAWRAK